MSTLTADPTPAQEAKIYVDAFRDLEQFFARHPQETASASVPWDTNRVLEFIDIAVEQKYWRVAEHLFAELTRRGELSPEEQRLLVKVRAMKAELP